MQSSQQGPNQPPCVTENTAGETSMADVAMDIIRKTVSVAGYTWT